MGILRISLSFTLKTIKGSLLLWLCWHTLRSGRYMTILLKEYCSTASLANIRSILTLSIYPGGDKCQLQIAFFVLLYSFISDAEYRLRPLTESCQQKLITPYRDVSQKSLKKAPNTKHHDTVCNTCRISGQWWSVLLSMSCSWLVPLV